MATPTLTNTPTIIDSAESISAWGGDTFTLNTDIKVAGNNSVECAITSTGANDVYVTGSWNFSTDVHLRLWVNTTNVPYIATLANNGIQIFLYDGSNTAYWTVGGSDTYSGGWRQFVLYTGNTATSGTVTKSSVTRIGMRFNNASRPKNVVNTWLDQWTYGDGFTVTGGSSSDPITWSGIAALDKTSAYGICTEVDGVYFLAGEITIGNGATATYLEDLGDVLVFQDRPVNSTLYKIIGEGSGCDIDINGGLLTASGTQNYVLDMDETNLSSLTISGKQISKASSILFKAGQDIQNNVFNNCGQIVCSTATFKFNTISNYVGTDGAVLFPSDDSNIANLTFINCDNCLEYDSSSDSTSPTLTSIVFDDVSGNYDVNNTSGSSVTLANTGSSNGNSYNPGGSSVTFEGSVTVTITVKDTSNVVINDAQVRVTRDSDSSVIINTATNASGIATASYNYGGDAAVTIKVRKSSLADNPRYFPVRTAGTITSAGLNATVVMQEDTIIG
jgi:hypothetical protein